jgi:hypothetical protein
VNNSVFIISYSPTFCELYHGSGGLSMSVVVDVRVQRQTSPCGVVMNSGIKIGVSPSTEGFVY